MVLKITEVQAQLEGLAREAENTGHIRLRLMAAYTLGEDNGKAQVFEEARSLMGGKDLEETKSAQRTASGAAVAQWLSKKADGESMGRTMSGFNTAPSATRGAGFCIVLWVYGPTAVDKGFIGADYDDAMAQAAMWCAEQMAYKPLAMAT